MIPNIMIFTNFGVSALLLCSVRKLCILFFYPWIKHQHHENKIPQKWDDTTRGPFKMQTRVYCDYVLGLMSLVGHGISARAHHMSACTTYATSWHSPCSQAAGVPPNPAAMFGPRRHFFSPACVLGEVPCVALPIIVVKHGLHSRFQSLKPHNWLICW